MNIGNDAEEFVRNHFEMERHIRLIRSRPKQGDVGYDFRNEESTLFVEVKGSKAKRWSDVLFSSFTNAQYEKAKECKRSKKCYEVHIVIGIGTNNVEHFKVPIKVFLENAKPEIAWSLPIRKKINEYRVDGKQSR
jgi:hypothetical protein